MAQEPDQRSGGGLKRFAVTVLVLGLLGAVLWLASERNQRHYSWTVENGKLVISKGRFFPTGQSPITAEDPQQGSVYGPIPVPQGAKVTEQEFEDQTALDRALFDLVLPWAKADVQKGDEPAMVEANSLADRVGGLPGLTPDQFRALSSVRSELSYASARGELAQAAKLVLSARRKLEAVNQSGSERALEAGPVARELAGVQEALEQAAQGRAANIFGSKQASSSAPPPPAQAQPPAATSQGATPPPPGPPPGINKSNPPTSAKQPQR
ncbi:MAG: hypothetical protein ACJ78Y_11320 [Myxococcales bacterium]